MNVDAVALQVMAGGLRSACEEMGAALVRAAHSPNIKERRDCSTALFDASGEMLMQAEHIPVHLGSMPAAVEAVIAAADGFTEGESWIVNDPYRGGTHLPDITVVLPVFDDDGLLGFAANRAHHADVGGSRPGSMPADSTSIEEEGVVIGPQPLTPDGLDRIVAGMRQPRQRRADLRAQVAANRTGAERLREMSRRHSPAVLRAGFREVLDYAERRTRACIAAMPDGTYTATDFLEAADGDLELRLVATVRGEEVTFDFTGSSAADRGNLNCPLAVTQSACFFAMRVLTDPDIPASAGAYRPVTVIAEPGSLLDARYPSAVVAGNVETSSRVADLCLAAFGEALGQGTMNNLIIGNERFAYYETTGGGQAAGADGPGPDGVHVAMSNTLNTPVEALEIEYPLRLRRYELRRGSGGEGRNRGGDGVVREVEALEEADFSILSERRRHRPRGAEGGGDGATGRNVFISDSEEIELPPKAQGVLRPGNRLRIETPGGGGWGVT